MNDRRLNQGYHQRLDQLPRKKKDHTNPFRILCLENLMEEINTETIPIPTTTTNFIDDKYTIIRHLCRRIKRNWYKTSLSKFSNIHNYWSRKLLLVTSRNQYNPFCRLLQQPELYKYVMSYIIIKNKRRKKLTKINSSIHALLQTCHTTYHTLSKTNVLEQKKVNTKHVQHYYYCAYAGRYMREHCRINTHRAYYLWLWRRNRLHTKYYTITKVRRPIYCPVPRLSLVNWNRNRCFTPVKKIKPIIKQLIDRSLRFHKNKQ